jgi:hypothetical protein
VPAQEVAPEAEWLTRPDVQALIGRLTERIATVALGFVPDHSQHRLVVIADPERREEAAIAAVLEDLDHAVPVSVVRGCRSAAEIAATEGLVKQRSWHPRAQHVEIGGYLDVGTGRWVVTVPADDAEIAEALRAVDPDGITVEIGSPQLLAGGRSNDSSPHYGGAAIWHGSVNEHCSAGYAGYNPFGVKVMVTAGHCWLNVDNMQVFSGLNLVGTYHRHYPWPDSDMAWVQDGSQTYSNSLYVDPCCPTVRSVNAYWDAGVGSFVCLSGHVTLAVCGVEVLATNAFFCIGPFLCIGNLTYGEKPGSTIAQPGDSGGPVYWQTGAATAGISGTMIAINNPSTIFFHKMTTIQANMGITPALN